MQHVHARLLNSYILIIIFHYKRRCIHHYRCSGVQFCDHDDGVHVMCWLIWSWRVRTLIVLLVVVPTDRTAAVLGCLLTLVRGSTVRDRFLMVPLDLERG